jgi:chemosensory pili system protein ChpA (sensor histidine kinase/response regulator)
MPISPELLAGFATEGTELLVRIAANIEQVHLNPALVSHLDEARRAAHQAKGAASMIGLADLAHVFYFMEESFEELRAGRVPWTENASEVLEECVWQLGECFHRMQKGIAPPDDGILTADIADALQALRGGLAAPEPRRPPAAPSTVPPELLEVFRLEADEHLVRIGDNLAQLEQAPERQDLLLEVRRSVHTLKGASGSVGFSELSKLSHRMEDLLDRLAEAARPLTAEHHNLLVSTYDALSDMAAGAEGLEERVHALYQRYDALEAPATPAISPELMSSFRLEAAEHLQAIQDQLRLLESRPADEELILSIRRTMHTIKGAAAMAGQASISRLAHRTEDLLDALASRTVSYGAGTQSLLYRAADTLADLIAGQPVTGLEELLKHFDAPAAVASVPEPAPLAEPAAQASAPSPSGQYVRVPIERLDELVRFVSELIVNRSVFEQHLGAYGEEIRELDLSLKRLKRLSQRLDADVEVTALRGGMGQLAVRSVLIDKRGEFDLLEFDRYTDLHLVSRDLAETAVDVTATASELRARAGDFDSYLNRLGRLTSDIQDRLMRMRMVPISSLSARLHRTVRVTSDRTGKPADFVLEGERVELDKTVLEEMAGPLEHVLRNAVDHGIESEVLRRALGKPARGRISLEARYEGTQVVLTVADDGAGINPELIRASIVDRGLVTEAEAAKLPDDRVLDYIFQPGFSTSHQVSEVSGRGVGMDVVKSAVARLKGSVELISTPGRGTRLIIRLPMTLAIMRVLLVKANGETFALPANVVTRILRADAESIARVNGKTVLRGDGEVFPLLRLSESLALKGQPDQAVARPPALLLQVGEQTVALIVDEIVDAREVVVKTMGTLLRKVRGFTGATLMGDGSVVLILDPSDLTGGRSPRSAHMTSSSPVRLPANRPLEILTVDDSVSVRRVLARLLESAGWKATPAKDGLEALEILQRGWSPDAILLDVEMPRMDGYELLGALRAMPQFANVPVVMLTSRAGEKHRKKAFQLGATDYLVKPYQDDTLLAVVRRVVREAKEAVVR